MSVETIISLRGIERRYPDGTVALRGVDLDVARGEFISIIGRSGSGKSTLLNVIGLLDDPSDGTYRLNGTPVSTLAAASRASLRARHLGFVFQAFHLLDARTSRENVELGGLYVGMSHAERAARARDLLGALGLRDREQALPRTLSGGERQRVAIARALMGAPSVLLCDEPTGNLDSANAGLVIESLRQVHASGTTVLLVTHDRGLAAQSARIVEVADGRIS